MYSNNTQSRKDGVTEFRKHVGYSTTQKLGQLNYSTNAIFNCSGSSINKYHQ